jgi:hypothetical protein
VETYNIAETATQTFDLSKLANGTVTSVTLNGTALTYTGTLSALTLNKSELYNNAYGEKKVYVNYTDENGEAKAVVINVYVVTREINNADELDAIRSEYTSRKSNWDVYKANYYVLGEDIDYTGRTGWNYDRALEPYGSNTSGSTNVYFTGTFDGAGYNIKGVTSTGWNGCMFYSITGTIKNVSFTNVTLGKKAALFNEAGGGKFENIYIHCTSVQSVALEGGSKQYTGFFTVETTDWNNYFKNIYIEIDANNTADGTPVYLTKNCGKLNINGMYAVGTGVSEALKADNWGAGVYAGGVYNTRADMQAADIDFNTWDDTIWTTDADGLPIFANLLNK